MSDRIATNRTNRHTHTLTSESEINQVHICLLFDVVYSYHNINKIIQIKQNVWKTIRLKGCHGDDGWGDGGGGVGGVFGSDGVGLVVAAVVFLMFRKRVNTTWHRTRACANANWMHIKCNECQPTNRTSDQLNNHQPTSHPIAVSFEWSAERARASPPLYAD